MSVEGHHQLSYNTDVNAEKWWGSQRTNRMDGLQYPTWAMRTNSIYFGHAEITLLLNDYLHQEGVSYTFLRHKNYIISWWQKDANIFMMFHSFISFYLYSIKTRIVCDCRLGLADSVTFDYSSLLFSESLFSCEIWCKTILLAGKNPDP